MISGILLCGSWVVVFVIGIIAGVKLTVFVFKNNQSKYAEMLWGKESE